MQEPKFPLSDSTHQTCFETATERRPSQRWLWCLAPALVALSLLSIGCPEPADLEKPESFASPGAPAGGSASGGSASGGTATGGSASGGSSSSSSCEVACVTSMFTSLCGTCHSNALKFAQLDLTTAGVSSRLKDQPSTHGDLPAGMNTGCPTGDKLIDSATPANSWLLKKVLNQQDNCGLLMPQGSELTADEKTCMQTYVNCVAGAAK